MRTQLDREPGTPVKHSSKLENWTAHSLIEVVPTSTAYDAKGLFACLAIEDNNPIMVL